MVIHVVVELSKCSGCRYCELWCSFLHEGVFSSSLSRIRVIRDDLIGMDYPVVCKHCVDAPCIRACKANALYKDTGGFTKLDKAKCIKCGECVNACPYGAVFQNPFDKTPLICDLCDGKPICVSKCPTNALSIHPVTEIPVKNPAQLGKRYSVALSEYKVLLERWGIRVKYE
ncbi:MAG: 4Fe-4S dicluster domain-containing protein [Desulfurococcaceae archaeon]